MKKRTLLLLGLYLSICVACTTSGSKLQTAGVPAQLDIRKAGDNSLRITLKPVDVTVIPETPAVADRHYPEPTISLREIKEPVKERIGDMSVEVTGNPLSVVVSNSKSGRIIQHLVFLDDGTLSFQKGDAPILGMGEGGPEPEKGSDWRTLDVEYDRRGRYHNMQPRWQSDAYGSRNPVAMLMGTEGWGLFVASPWVEVNLENGQERGVFVPWKPAQGEDQPQTHDNQGLRQTKGRPPADQVIPGLYDLFVFDAEDPTAAIKDFSIITGPSVMPPKWALGYMQSHRTLDSEKQMIGIVDTFRTKRIPLDAVIYLGTGFVPKGWNTEQPSFDYHPDIFKRGGKPFFQDMHNRHVKVGLHMVPWDRDELPTLHGSIPVGEDEVVDNGHILNYWKQHEALVHDGTDFFWPDEGDWFNLHERIKRHQLYYQGSLYTTPNIRPWSLQRNGYPGIAQWGGWVWSGDTDASWKTLEAQIAVGINYSLSIGPFWGSDIGGFYSNKEKTGELYARWFQFGAFCGSFRSHARTWRLSLPWGWGSDNVGVRENTNDNSPTGRPDRNILLSELNNHTIEPIAKRYTELRYQLMPYIYTLTWEARNEGLPLMRAMWLHYPNDEIARTLGNQYLWGRDMLIAPVFQKGAETRDVYLPDGLWYDWWTNKKENGKQTISRTVDLATMPIFVRAGAIIPFDPIRQYAMQKVNEPTTIKIYSGDDGRFTLYEDDGTSLDYLQGEAAFTTFAWDDAAKKLTVTPGENNGYAVGARTFKVQVLPQGTIREITYTGKPTELTF